jgi:hypothetical protein
LPRTGTGIRDDRRPTDAPDYSDLSSLDGWEAHLERTFRLGTTDNGVFGAKLMFNHGVASKLPRVWIAVRKNLRSVVEQVTLADVASVPRLKLVDGSRGRGFRRGSLSS